MDVESFDPQTASQVLQSLEWINRWLGGVAATLSGLSHFSKRWKAGEIIRFVDWGTGGADIPRAMVRWGRKHGFHFEIVGVDRDAQLLEYARVACRDYPEIRFVQNTFETSLPDLGSIDYAISSLTLHHLSNDQIVSLLQQSNRLVKRGILMNDLIRSRRAVAWSWSLTRLLGMPSMVQHDAPLSVKRAFIKKDLEQLAQTAGLSYLKVNTHFGYRYTLSGEKASHANA